MYFITITQKEKNPEFVPSERHWSFDPNRPPQYIEEERLRSEITNEEFLAVKKALVEAIKDK